MTRPSRSLWLAFAGLALAGLAPSSARAASCGHYVLIGSPSHHASEQAANPAKAPASELPSMPVPSHPGHKPCSGPGCSQGGEPLLPLPTTPSSPDEERWGQNALDTLAAGLPADFLPLVRTTGRPVRSPSSIYHPPR